jgi:hypothetical protein
MVLIIVWLVVRIILMTTSDMTSRSLVTLSTGIRVRVRAEPESESSARPAGARTESRSRRRRVQCQAPAGGPLAVRVTRRWTDSAGSPTGSLTPGRAVTVTVIAAADHRDDPVVLQNLPTKLAEWIPVARTCRRS